MSLIQKINDSLDEATKLSLRKLAAQFSGEAPAVIPAPATTPVVTEKKFGEAPLPDGTSIKYEGDKLDVGVPVLMVTPEGELPAPDGEITLADGTVITIVGGLVSEMKPATPAAPAPAESPELMSRITQLETELASLKTRLSAVKPNTELAALKDQVKTLTVILSKICDTPTTDPIEQPTSTFAKRTDEKFARLTKFKTNN